MANLATQAVPLVNLPAQILPAASSTGVQYGVMPASASNGQLPNQQVTAQSGLQAQPITSHAATSEETSWRWITVTLVGLILTVLATFWTIATGVPLLALARWTADNDYYQYCTALLGQNRSLTNGCSNAISAGPTEPPYRRDVGQHMVRRDFGASDHEQLMAKIMEDLKINDDNAMRKSMMLYCELNNSSDCMSPSYGRTYS